MEENPEAVKKGLEILTESQLLFVRACIKEGIDGFYTSTQGSEAKRYSTPAIFSKYVKPFDLVSMKEISSACPFNILHVCDYVAPYANYDAVYDYPGHVVNCNVKLTDRQISGQEIVKLFKRPFMGGMDRHGIIATGTPAQVWKPRSGARGDGFPASLPPRRRLHRGSRHQLGPLETRDLGGPSGWGVGPLEPTAKAPSAPGRPRLRLDCADRPLG